MRSASDVGQREHHGSGRRKRKFGRSRSGSKRPAVKQGSENIHRRRVGETGLQNHSVTSQLHHVRLQTPCHAADPGNERAQGSRRPVVPSSSKPHAPYDREEKRDGKFRQRVQASDRVTRKVERRLCSPRRSLAEAGQPPPKQAQRFSRRTLAACDKRFFTAPTIGERFAPLVSPAPAADMAMSGGNSASSAS